jgi:endonuclease YncB( thermonuclease family)
VLDGSVDAGLEKIRAGYAWWYRAYAKEQSPEDQAAYERAEDEAREAKRGFWKELKPVPPWDWRKDH